MMEHDWEPYFVYRGAFGWDERLIQKCRVCNLLREMQMKPPFLASLRRLLGACLGAYGKYVAGPHCPGRPVVPPQLDMDQEEAQKTIDQCVDSLKSAR